MKCAHVCGQVSKLRDMHISLSLEKRRRVFFFLAFFFFQKRHSWFNPSTFDVIPSLRKHREAFSPLFHFEEGWRNATERQCALRGL